MTFSKCKNDKLIYCIHKVKFFLTFIRKIFLCYGLNENTLTAGEVHCISVKMRNACGNWAIFVHSHVTQSLAYMF